MNFSLNLTLSDHDKEWIVANVVAPIVGSLDGIKDAVGSKQEVLKAIQAAHARIDELDTLMKGQK